MKKEKNKVLIKDSIDEHRQHWEELALKIHANPELSFNEYKASGWLTDELAQEGFHVRKHLISELPTSFIAEWGDGTDGPTIGFIAEYDALAGLGHACGHNIIGTASVSAAVELKRALGDIPGKIVVFGTPAEEEGGGKIMLAEAGWFENVDAVLMCHPRDKTMVLRGSLACVDIDITYHGKSAHAAANPEKGINALDAVIQSFIAVKQLLPMMHRSANIHGIITKGGDATNVIPDHCEASFLLRAQTTNELADVKKRFYRAVESAASSVGASCEMKEGLTYAERMNNYQLAMLFKENLQSIGVEVDDSEIKVGVGSSDIGNVSQLVPTIHPYIKIGEAITHTNDFTEAAASKKGMEGMIQASKALALTAYDLLESPAQIKEIKEEWENTTRQV